MNTQRWLRVAVLTFLSVAAFGQVGFKQDERMMIQKFKASNAKLEEGRALFAKGKLDKAEKKLMECLETFPKNADARFIMAQILLKRNEFDAALASIESAEKDFVEIAQLYAFTHQEMMNDLRAQKEQVQESIRTQEAALAQLMARSRSDSTQSAVTGAEASLQQNKNLIAKIDMQLQNPIPQTMEIPAGYRYIHGNILLKRKDLQGAVNQYLETIRLEPAHEFASNNLASIYFTAKQYEKALECLRRAEANGVKINLTFKKDLEDRLGVK
ncbi:MAG TPA: tetratricopeptide repeat protein [Acidobacteriota bacterium]|nr:tetratricopeptide repeat protein [Acidobacteriota bacterium]